MNELDMLRKLGSAARDEKSPPVDVAGPVLRDIAARRDRSGWTLGLAALGACAAAAAVALVAWQVVAAGTDPLNALVTSVTGVMQ